MTQSSYFQYQPQSLHLFVRQRLLFCQRQQRIDWLHLHSALIGRPEHIRQPHS
ncbi:MAG: hypothetical protein IKH05_03675 [Bacteroidaceae bacterium]|nr:hypothetical protein [Bacteroidaceae bacterium]